jgi:hypothetical protein
MAKGSATPKNYFANVNISKEDGFPSLLVHNANNCTYVRISADGGINWTSNVDSWLSSHGASGVILLA